MSRPSVLVVVLLAAAGLGCAADLGGGGGIEARTAHAVGFGRAAASTKVGTPLNNDCILIGSSLESRTEAKLGARYDVGLMLGWGTGPAAIGGKWGFEAYLEGGTPIRGGFFRDGDWFLGGTVAAPFHMGSPRQVQELNGSTWFATSRLEVVPMLRLRRHRDHPEDADALTRVDVELGLVFRLRVLSDLF